METTKTELKGIEEPLTKGELQELFEAQLALVGGGIGDVIVG